REAELTAPNAICYCGGQWGDHDILTTSSTPSPTLDTAPGSSHTSASVSNAASRPLPLAPAAPTLTTGNGSPGQGNPFVSVPIAPFMHLAASTGNVSQQRRESAQRTLPQHQTAAGRVPRGRGGNPATQRIVQPPSSLNMHVAVLPICLEPNRVNTSEVSISMPRLNQDGFSNLFKTLDSYQLAYRFSNDLIDDESIYNSLLNTLISSLSKNDIRVASDPVSEHASGSGVDYASSRLMILDRGRPNRTTADYLCKPAPLVNWHITKSFLTSGKVGGAGPQYFFNHPSEPGATVVLLSPRFAHLKGPIRAFLPASPTPCGCADSSTHGCYSIRLLLRFPPFATLNKSFNPDNPTDTVDFADTQNLCNTDGLCDYCPVCRTGTLGHEESAENASQSVHRATRTRTASESEAGPSTIRRRINPPALGHQPTILDLGRRSTILDRGAPGPSLPIVPLPLPWGGPNAFSWPPVASPANRLPLPMPPTLPVPEPVPVPEPTHREPSPEPPVAPKFSACSFDKPVYEKLYFAVRGAIKSPSDLFAPIITAEGDYDVNVIATCLIDALVWLFRGEAMEDFEKGPGISAMHLGPETLLDLFESHSPFEATLTTGDGFTHSVFHKAVNMLLEKPGMMRKRSSKSHFMVPNISMGYVMINEIEQIKAMWQTLGFLLCVYVARYQRTPSTSLSPFLLAALVSPSNAPGLRLPIEVIAHFDRDAALALSPWFSIDPTSTIDVKAVPQPPVVGMLIELDYDAVTILRKITNEAAYDELSSDVLIRQLLHDDGMALFKTDQFKALRLGFDTVLGLEPGDVSPVPDGPLPDLPLCPPSGLLTRGQRYLERPQTPEPLGTPSGTRYTYAAVDVTFVDMFRRTALEKASELDPKTAELQVGIMACGYGDIVLLSPDELIATFQEYTCSPYPDCDYAKEVAERLFMFCFFRYLHLPGHPDHPLVRHLVEPDVFEREQNNLLLRSTVLLRFLTDGPILPIIDWSPEIKFVHFPASSEPSVAVKTCFQQIIVKINPRLQRMLVECAFAEDAVDTEFDAWFHSCILFNGDGYSLA
ncbi:hypothetical protein EUX98_g8548, partial [Antrodiella citrinella]